MLKYLAPRFPPRTVASHLTTITLDNGRSKLIFNDSQIGHVAKAKPSYLVTNHLPPAPPPPTHPDTPNSSLCPPFHIHLKEDETFHVLSGQAKFLFLDQYHRGFIASKNTSTKNGITTQIAQPDTTVTIPKGQIHTFRNASTTDPLIIEFGFSPPYPPPSNTPTPTPTCTSLTRPNTQKAQIHAKMHRFFRNTQLYRSDCTTNQIPRSLIQVLLFNHDADVALVPNFLLGLHRRYPVLRGVIEQFIAPGMGRVMNVFGGVVLGKWVFGLRGSYKEYYNLEQTHISPKVRSNPGVLGDKPDK